jgi:starch synthase
VTDPVAPTTKRKRAPAASRSTRTPPADAPIAPGTPPEAGTESPPLANAESERVRSAMSRLEPWMPNARGGLKVLMVAPEAMPFAKTGGLADVAGALPIALGALGHDVTLVLPRYRGAAVTGDPIARLTVRMGSSAYDVAFYQSTLGPGARAILVDQPSLFDRESLYGVGNVDYPDNPRRFGLLATAALELAIHTGLQPDVVHAHDWQGGLVPVLLRTRYRDEPTLKGAAAVFTVHNVAYQGLFASHWLTELGLGWDLFTVDALEYWLNISFLKGGIVFSDLVTTVSQRYAQELLTKEFAFGFEGVFASRRDDLVGILNGVDTSTWNPETDPHIPQPFSTDILEGKLAAKRRLLETYGLPSDDAALERPVVGMVARMVTQKGLDLIAQIAGELPRLDATFTILGTGEARYEEMWRALAARHPDRVGARIGFFDEALAHLIEAGADLFLMPSRFEPCGLNQMYSLRYGTLPVVRATGGLDDTVEGYDPESGGGNGFKFAEASGTALLGTLRLALEVYRRAPEDWRLMQRRGMLQDFSWSASARAYEQAYGRAISRVRARVVTALTAV